MIAEFYLIAESFAYNSSLSKDEIEGKIVSLARDFIYIRKYKETNKLYVHPDIYQVKLINNTTISDLLNNDAIANKNLDRDARIFLKKIVWETEATNITSKEVKDNLLPKHDENICYGLIGFNIIENLDLTFQIVYNKRGWLEFRRHYLGIYPKNPDFYVEECKKYFPKIFFHERVKTEIGSILKDCPKKIIYHLAALNDKFRDSQNQPNLNRSQVLEHFSTNANLDEKASLEGNAERKPDYTFLFLNTKSKEEEKVCCEPHLKLCFSDTDTSYSTERRIYFHEGMSNIANGNILIGHIGKHL